MDSFDKGRNNTSFELSTPESLRVAEIGVLNLRPGEFWFSPSTCTTYSFVLNPGLYRFEAWGAAGGSFKEEYISYGGYSRGDLVLFKPTLLFATAGDVGQWARGDSVKTVPGGCNGGGAGLTRKYSDRYYSGGGGASHVAALVNDLEHRFIVAGGAGGSFHTTDPSLSLAKGGEGGGRQGSDGHGDGWSGKGATEKSPGRNCTIKSGCSPGSFGIGGSVDEDWGCGAGAGWFGGAASFASAASGGGGSGFVFDGSRGTGCDQIDNHPLIGVFPILTEASTVMGQNPGKGAIRITRLLLISKNICHLRPQGVGIVVSALLCIPRF